MKCSSLSCKQVLVCSPPDREDREDAGQDLNHCRAGERYRCWIWKEQAQNYLAPTRHQDMVNGLAQSPESFSVSNYALHLMKRKITLKSKIKSAFLQPVWK